MIQGVNIYDRCPSLDIVLAAVLDCYMDVTSSRNQDGAIPWDNIYLWCSYHGVHDREYYLNVVKNVDAEIKKRHKSKTTVGLKNGNVQDQLKKASN